MPTRCSPGNAAIAPASASPSAKQRAGVRLVRREVGVQEHRHNRHHAIRQTETVDIGIGVSLILSLRHAPHHRDIEAVPLQCLDQVPRQHRIARMLYGTRRLQVAAARPRHPVVPRERRLTGVTDRFAIVDADRRHVGLVEQFLLVVADHDQRIQLRRGYIAGQPADRRLHLSVPLRQPIRRDPLQRVGRRIGQQRVIAARIAVQIDVRAGPVTAQETAVPVFHPRSQHRAVRRTERRHQSGHGPALPCEVADS